MYNFLCIHHYLQSELGIATKFLPFLYQNPYFFLFLFGPKKIFYVFYAIPYMYLADSTHPEQCLFL